MEAKMGDMAAVVRAREYACFPKARFIDATDGAPIACTVLGEGTCLPILFVNGWSCTDTYWCDIAPS
jgi:hypothetical protein